MEHENDGDINCNWCSWYSYEGTGTRTGGLGNKRREGDHQNYCFVKIRQNTEKSPGHLTRLVVTQTPVRIHRLMQVGKTQKGVNITITTTSFFLPPHMDKQRQDDQLEPIYNSSVPIQDIALKTSWEQWTIETGGERGSRRSVLAV